MDDKNKTTPGIDADPDSFTIYQLKNDDTTRDFRFEPYDCLLTAGRTVDPANYKAVYTAPLAPDMTLDDIFYRFNVNRPEGFTGRSLSVSDVVVLHHKGKDTAHYVDTVGYKELPEFQTQSLPLPPRVEKPSVREQLKAGKKKAAKKAPPLSKFEDVDVFEALHAIMKQNTGFYPTDFDVDKKMFARAADMPDRADRTFLWFSRPMGTNCFRERDVFVKGIGPYTIWRYYYEQSNDRILAYAVEVTGRVDGKIRGNLYELNFAQHYEHISETALDAETINIIYENGERQIPVGQRFFPTPDPEYGKYVRYEYLPRDPDALQDLLREERKNRERLAPGDFTEHIAALHDGLIESEARRIVTEMKRLDSPNSPGKTHYMVELAPVFLHLASTEDADRLFAMLPYKSLSFSKVGDKYGIYALISKHENRDVSIRKSQPKRKIQKCVSR